MFTELVSWHHVEGAAHAPVRQVPIKEVTTIDVLTGPNTQGYQFVARDE